MGVRPSFNFDAEKFVVDVKGVSEKLKKEIAEDIYSNLVETTPRDTGLARSSWDMSRNAPKNYSILKPKPPEGRKKGQPFIDPPTMTVPEGDGNLFIFNNLSYVYWLNFGTRKIVPRGFVEISVDRALRDKNV